MRIEEAVGWLQHQTVILLRIQILIMHHHPHSKMVKEMAEIEIIATLTMNY